MSYQVLARQYRPKQFNDVVGQEHVVRALTNALTQQRLHHAYLFTGTRGVGKTTLARIIAKALNCINGVSATPCGTCEHCQSIDAGNFPDLIEVDAASKTKVEDTREILDNVPYAPAIGRFKVYLIDEVHMLSNHSFNALLKTLEEPPEHVKFLLATTEQKKLPVTILSRCLQFNLRLVTVEQITTHLDHIATQENISYEPDALALIAKAANGSVRDSLSLLDQAIAYSHPKLTTGAVSDMLGLTNASTINALLNALITKDTKEIFSLCQEIRHNGADCQHILRELLNLLHQISLQQFTDNHLNDDLRQQAQSISPEDIQLFYQIGLLGQRDLPLAPSPYVGLEMTLLRMLAFRPNTNNGTISSNEITTSEPNKISQVSSTPSNQQSKMHENSAITNEVIAASNSKSSKTPRASSTSGNQWSQVRENLAVTGVAKVILEHCVVKTQDENSLLLLLDDKQAPLLTNEIKQRLTTALSDYYQRSIVLSIETTTDNIASPAQEKQKKQQQAIAKATQAIQNDTNAGHLIEQFNGTICPNSTQPTGETK